MRCVCKEGVGGGGGRGVIIKAGSKGRKSAPKVGSKFGQSNSNTKHSPIGMKFGT